MGHAAICGDSSGQTEQHGSEPCTPNIWYRASETSPSGISIGKGSETNGRFTENLLQRHYNPGLPAVIMQDSVGTPMIHWEGLNNQLSRKVWDGCHLHGVHTCLMAHFKVPK